MLKITAADISAYIKRFAQTYAAFLHPLCDKYGLAQTELDILLFLANNPGRDTAKDICSCKNLKPGIVSLYVGRLVNSGYLERREVPSDRRRTALICTKKAEDVIARGREYQGIFAARLTEGLEQEELDLCLRCLDMLDSNLQKIMKDLSIAKKE